MTIAARRIDPEVWSQRRYLTWLENQPEGVHYEFDGVRPVAMSPATVGHNRIGDNIRNAIRHRLPTSTPCRVYGPQDTIETVGGALREPDAFIACSQPLQNEIIVPAPIIVFEVLSPGQQNRRRDEQEKADEYESVPTILRYVVIESERRGYQVFWRDPGDRAWRQTTPGNETPLSLPEFGIELPLDEIYAGLTWSP